MIATRLFEVGEELLHCAGTIAILNEQEEKELENRTSDFSVIKTSRKGTCLFLGPARFVNVCPNSVLAFAYGLKSGSRTYSNTESIAFDTYTKMLA